MPTIDYRSRSAAASAALYGLLQITLLVFATVVLVQFPPRESDPWIVALLLLILLSGLVFAVRFRPQLTPMDFALKFWTRSLVWMLIMHEYPILRIRPLYRQVRPTVWDDLDKHMSQFHSPSNRDWNFKRHLKPRFWWSYGGAIIRLWCWLGVGLSLAQNGYTKKRYQLLRAAVYDIVHLDNLYAIVDGALSDAMSDALATPPLGSAIPDEQVLLVEADATV